MAKRTILLVDDDVTLRELLADALELEGFTILRAGNGEEGVAAALAGKPDLVISDIVMPEMNVPARNCATPAPTSNPATGRR